MKTLLLVAVLAFLAIQANANLRAIRGAPLEDAEMKQEALEEAIVINRANANVRAIRGAPADDAEIKEEALEQAIVINRLRDTTPPKR